MRSEGFYVNEKSPMTPAGFEPATFRLVEQHLNHCATAVPNKTMLHLVSDVIKENSDFRLAYKLGDTIKNFKLKKRRS